MAKKLEVKNLTISFKTMNGKVQAVRDISFDLEQGETLAIVGESGSGKSVTSKAIMGISAVNAIIESGEILYDGHDLTKITEEQFHDLRGNKIAMIFQDPLSSLNPIMRIGKQLTEAMLLKGKANQREARKNFNSHLKTLKCYLTEHFNTSFEGEEAKEKINESNKMIARFNDFEVLHTKLENAFNNAKEHATDALQRIDELLFRFEKKAVVNFSSTMTVINNSLSKVYNQYFISKTESDFADVVSYMHSLQSSAGRLTKKNKYQHENVKEFVKALKDIRDTLDFKLKEEPVNFFCLAFYLKNSKEPLPNMGIDQLNAFLRNYLDDNYMLDFIKLVEQGIKFGKDKSIAKKSELLPKFADLIETANNMEGNISRVSKNCKELAKGVIDAYDVLDFKLDNTERTFDVATKDTIEKFRRGIISNRKEEARFAKQSAKYERIIKSGKNVDWKVVPKSLVNLNNIKNDLVSLLNRMVSIYEEQINRFSQYDLDRYNKRAVKLIDYFKEQASRFVYKVTPSMAKERAIKLMEEVGIADARNRYYRYPFEFSGGMRQRIVIAIALAANPDILICDEPTTALDVTIQSQILELINKIKKERNLSIIFITHDLGVVANMADRVAVMYAGKIVEYGTSSDVFYDPRHPYTWALLSSMPDLDTNEKLEAIPGTPPNMIYPPVGDAFAVRNKYALKIDFEKQPPLFKISDTHYAATWLLHPDAPKIPTPKIITDRIKRMKKQTKEFEAKEDKQ